MVPEGQGCGSKRPAATPNAALQTQAPALGAVADAFATSQGRIGAIRTRSAQAHLKGGQGRRLLRSLSQGPVQPGLPEGPGAILEQGRLGQGRGNHKKEQNEEPRIKKI